jgi:hypothetical protein
MTCPIHHKTQEIRSKPVFVPAFNTEEVCISWADRVELSTQVSRTIKLSLFSSPQTQNLRPLKISTTVTSYQYPSDYKPLVDAVLRASGGKCEVPVQWSHVAGYFATHNKVEGRWWSRFSTLHSSAAKKEVIEETQEVTANGIRVKHIILRTPKEEWKGASWGILMVRHQVLVRREATDGQA